MTSPLLKIAKWALIKTATLTCNFFIFLYFNSTQYSSHYSFPLSIPSHMTFSPPVITIFILLSPISSLFPYFISFSYLFLFFFFISFHKILKFLLLSSRIKQTKSTTNNHFTAQFGLSSHFITSHTPHTKKTQNLNTHFPPVTSPGGGNPPLISFSHTPPPYFLAQNPHPTS
jgi:hypothetical protein